MTLTRSRTSQPSALTSYQIVFICLISKNDFQKIRTIELEGKTIKLQIVSYMLIIIGVETDEINICQFQWDTAGQVILNLIGNTEKQHSMDILNYSFD